MLTDILDCIVLVMPLYSFMIYVFGMVSYHSQTLVVLY